MARIGRWGRPAAAGQPAHLQFGRTGERLAEKFLRRLGYRIVTRNYTCPQGEIDLVALDGRTVVFVEVKSRQSREAADPEDAVTPGKRDRILAAARQFLRQTSSEDRPCRGDIIAITWQDPRSAPRIEHFQEAFSPAGR